MKNDNHKQIDIDVLIEDNVVNDSSTVPDSKDAISEQQLFNDKNLEQIAKSNEHKRTESWRNQFSWGFVIAFWILWFCFLSSILVLFAHWLLPEKCRWLNAEELSQIKTLIIAVLASQAIINQQNKLK